MAAALLPNNEMLVWSADQDLAYGQSDPDDWTQTAILNLTTGAVSEDTVTNTDHNMFCPGVVILPNGDIMVTGGISDHTDQHLRPDDELVERGAADEHRPRLPGHDAAVERTGLHPRRLVVGRARRGGKLGEVWSPTGGWRELTDVPATPMYTEDAQGVYRADNHGWFIATSGGKVLQAGPVEADELDHHQRLGQHHPGRDARHQRRRHERQRRLLRHRQDHHHGRGARLPGLKRHQQGLRDPHRIQPATTATGHPGRLDELCPRLRQQRGAAQRPGRHHRRADLRGAVQRRRLDSEPRAVEPEHRHVHGHGARGRAPQLSLGGPPAARRHGVLRRRRAVRNLLDQPSRRADLHSALPVQRRRHPAHPPDHHLGSDLGGHRPDDHGHHRRAGVAASPWSATERSTHTVDNDQRRIPLSIVSSSGDTYQLAIPSDPGIALPGPYMLFALNAQGTPSVSTTISITNVPTQPPADSYGQAVFGDGPAIYWPLNDANGSTTAADLSGNGDTGIYSSGGITYRAPSPVEGASGTGVTLDGASGQIVASQPITNPTTYSEEMWFKTTTDNGGTPHGLRQLTQRDVGRAGPAGMDVERRAAQLRGLQRTAEQTVVVQSPQSYNDGNWHYVVATQGPDGMNLYVDGQLVGSNPNGEAQSYLGYWRVGAEDVVGLARLAHQQLLPGRALRCGLLQLGAVRRPSPDPLPSVRRRKSANGDAGELIAAAPPLTDRPNWAESFGPRAGPLSRHRAAVRSRRPIPTWSARSG